MTIAIALPASVLIDAGSNITPGSNGPRANHGSSAPITNAPTNWNRLRVSSDTRATGESRSWRITPSCPELVEGSQRPPLDRLVECAVAPHAFQVSEHAVRADQRHDLVVGQRAILVVRNGADHQVVGLAVELGQPESVLALDLRCVGIGVGDG